MADRIHASSEWLDKCARDLQGVENAISSASKKLSSVNLRRDEGGNLRTSMSFSLRMNGVRFSANNAADDIRQLQRAARAFEDAENKSISILKAMISGENADIYEGSKGSSDGKVTQESVDSIISENRRRMIEEVLKQLEKDDSTLWPAYIDWDWLYKAAYLGHIFTFLDGNESELDSNHMAWLLLDGLIKNYGTQQGLTNDYQEILSNTKDVVGTVKDVTDTVKNILTMCGGDAKVIKKAGETFQKVKDDWTIVSTSSSAMDGMLDAIKGIKEGTKAAENVVKAYNRWQALINLDDQTVESLRSGLLQNGDPASKAAADMLALSRDPAACFGACVLQFAGDTLEDGVIDACKTVVKSTSVGRAIDIGTSVGTAFADNTMGTSDTALSAQRTLQYNQMRQKSSDAVRQTAEAYRANPSDATYAQFQNAYRAYNAISGEMANSYKKAVDSTTDSWIGKSTYKNTDTSYLDDLGQTFYARNNNI